MPFTKKVPQSSSSVGAAQDLEEDEPVPTTEVEPAGAARPASTITSEQLSAMQAILDIAYDHRMPDGHDPSKVFHRKVNKRFLPDYYEVIKEPISFSTIKAKLFHKTYTSINEFVRDWALIIHNAQVYNRPDAGAYHDALEIKRVVQQELQKLVDRELITAETATFPYLGEIPPQDALPAEENERGEEEEDEDDEEDEEGGDESDDSKAGRKRKIKLKRTKTEDDSKDDTAAAVEAEAKNVRSKRPPRVDTPLEARLRNILKGMRRFRNQADEHMVSHFDRLPDRAVMPGYYEEIRSPMAMDILKRKVKRKKYLTIDEFSQDVNLMFENAKAFNEDDSQIYEDAVALQGEIQKLIAAEQRKPDSDYVMEDGRLPLPEGILHNGEVYKVGDWVLIQNANDLTKPIVSQIYRTWQDASGHKFINACWYYRPEQTVHRFDKHFYENEVVKTGRYCDHSIDEVVDRCFVMFITRYSKGRPRNFPRDKEIYVCESRYNEEKLTLNKIKTWASCLPDEVRDKDYEMELYQEPKRMKKLPSPIAYLLKDSQKETDDPPKVEWGADKAPPKIGAVHRRPREAKDSPPPEPTPEPQAQPTPLPTQPTRQAPPSLSQTNSYSRAPNPNFTIPTPARQANMGASPQTSTTAPPPMRSYQPILSPAAAAQSSQVPRLNSYSAHTPQAPPISRISSDTNNPLQRYQSQTASYPGSASYKAPQPIEVWSLNDQANASIPPDIREQFQRDEVGRVLFFTAPPLDTQALVRHKEGMPFGHSVSYLARKAERDAKVREFRKRKAEEKEQQANEKLQKVKAEQGELHKKFEEVTKKAMEVWQRQMAEETRQEFEALYGKDDVEQKIQDRLARLEVMQREAAEESSWKI